MTYYEKNARMNASDREVIIGMGFLEWLLAAINSRAGSAAAKPWRGVRAPVRERQERDIVILIANLLGGVIDEQD